MARATYHFILLLSLAAIQLTLFPAVTFAARSRGCSNKSFSLSDTDGRMPVAGSTTTHSIMHDGIERSFNIHLPRGYTHSNSNDNDNDNNNGWFGFNRNRDTSTNTKSNDDSVVEGEGPAYPLVMSFHGWCSNGGQDEFFSGFSNTANDNGFIVVYAEGVGDRSGSPRRNCQSWNCVGSTQSPGPLGETCEKWLEDDYCYDSCSCNKPSPGYNNQCDWTTCSNDITMTGIGTNTTGAFIPRLMDLMEDIFCIDTAREYATGMSNGGMMSYQMGVSLSKRLAAIAPTAATFPHGFIQTPEVPVALLHLHGLADTEIPPQKVVSRLGWKWSLTQDVVNAWADANECEDIRNGRAEDRRFENDITRRLPFHDLNCEFIGDCKNGDVLYCLWNGQHMYLGTKFFAVPCCIRCL